MEIELRFRDRASAESREHAERQAHLHLSRFGRELTRVLILVGEGAGPRGGARCQAIATVTRLGSTSVEARAAGAAAAIELALQRLARAVGEELDRLRGGSRPSPGGSPHR